MDGTATFLYPIDVPPLTLPASEMRFPTLQPAGAFLQQMHSRFADPQPQQQPQHKHVAQLVHSNSNSHGAASPTSPSSVATSGAPSSFLASIRLGLDDLVRQYDEDDESDDDSEDEGDDTDDASRYYYASNSSNTFYSPPSALRAPVGYNAPVPQQQQQLHQLQPLASNDHLMFDMEL